MKPDFIVFNDEAAANAWIAAKDAELGYPNANTKSGSIATPIVRQDGKAIVILKPIFSHVTQGYRNPDAYLSALEKANPPASTVAEFRGRTLKTRITWEVADLEGWFPKPEEFAFP